MRPSFCLPAILILLFVSPLQGQATQATTTTIAATPTAAAAGTTVKLTATVNGSSQSAVPQGTVTFRDGSQTIGTGALAGANLSAPTLVSASQWMGTVDSRAAGLIVTGDLNGDTKVDMLSYSGTAFQVFLNDGAGHYNALPAQTYSASTPFYEPALLDVNGDGYVDIALPGATTLSVLLGNGAGTFAAPVSFPGVSAQALTSPPDGGNVISALGYADFDGDGLTDLIIGELQNGTTAGNLSEVVSVYKNNGSGNFAYLGSSSLEDGTNSTALAGTVKSFAFADVTSDGKLDVLVAYDNAGMVGVLVNDGAGNLSVTTRLTLTCTGLGVNCTPCDAARSPNLGGPNGTTICGPSMTTGDFANRGKADLVLTVGNYSTSNPAGNIFVYPGNGDGTFGSPHVFRSVAAAPAWAGRFAVGYPSVVETDLNGDGNLDLLDSLGYGYLGDGAYNFTATDNLLGYVYGVVNWNGQTVAQILMADFSGDGIPDFYFQSAPLDGNPLFLKGSVSSVATLSTASLAAGTHPVTAQYAGNGGFAGSTSAAVTVAIGAQKPTITAGGVPSTALVGQPITFSVKVTSAGAVPTGTVTFTDGSTIVGTATLDSTGAGSFTASFATVAIRTITASYAGDAFTQAATTTFPITIAAGLSTSTSLVSSANPVLAGANVTFTATVSGTGTQTGNVVFVAGTANLGTVALTKGVAVLTTSFNTFGAQTVTANYTGDKTNAPSSGSLTETVLTTFAAQPGGNTTLAVSAGGNTTAPLTVTAQNGFSGTVTFSCTGLPSGATCTFNPASVTVSGSTAGSTTLTVSTTQTIARTISLPFERGAGIVWAGVLFGCLGFVRRRRRLVATLLACALTIGLGLLAGCSGGGSTSAGAHSYSFNVVASSGSVQTSTAYTLNVQ